MKKHVYFFGGGKAEGNGKMKDILGGKGSGLAEMTNIGLPVPAGFTITVETCEEYYSSGKKFPEGMEDEVRKHLADLEKVSGKKFGDPNDPLLVSVRSGAARSMPGMMETILNLGLNDKTVEGLAKKTNNPRFAYDSYRRFIQMYSTTAMGLPKESMEEMLTQMKKKAGVKTDPELNADQLKELCKEYQAFYRNLQKTEFPQDPMEQLWGSVKAVFGSWMAEKAVTYRQVEKITDLKGTAVSVVQMVFGNKGDSSGTGVCFTRNPSNGDNEFYGDCLINAQGEDVVAGIRTPMKLSELDTRLHKAYAQLCDVRKILEANYKDMQDIEFTIEEEKLYILQCRSGKRTPAARFRIASDMVAEGLLTRGEAVSSVAPEDIERLFYPVIDEEKVGKSALKSAFAGKGIDAVPGAAVGRVMFTAHEAEAAAAKGDKVVLVRKETSPEDVGGMHAAQGILTATGGKTSHAAVVARGWGKCCIVGCEALNIKYDEKTMELGGKHIKQGDFITLNGSTGEVFVGEMALKKPELPKSYYTVMEWADAIRTLKVRTNADTPYDSENAVRMGAEGIGLCRTEHMFFDTEDRRLAMQEMIVADTLEARKKALAKLLPIQRNDFIGIFKAMAGKPVTIRLVDPPLHEFTPKDEKGMQKLSKITGLSVEQISHRCEQLHESNPMLGHRGCRLCITYPEILEMQVTAIIEAAIDCHKKGIQVIPEIMHPLTMDGKEYRILDSSTRKIADELIKKADVKVPYLVGTMIEIPRAALLADDIAKVAEFFSFGTNDLTQMTMGLSRDDAGRFLPDYVDEKKAGIFKNDPFQSLDQSGVGQLVEMAIKKGRLSRANIKLGVCGEHGGDPQSIEFFHNVGLNYVSCSPYRVPIARLAAAHAVLKAKAKAGVQEKVEASSKKEVNHSKSAEA